MRIVLNDYLRFCLLRVDVADSMSCFFHAIRTIASFFTCELIDEVKCAIVMHAFNVKYFECEYVGYDFFDKYNYDGLEIIANQIENDVEFVVNSLAEGFPVISFVDSATLHYHSVYERNRGELHTIIIYGIDSFKNTVFVYDPHIRLNDQNFDTFHGEIQIDNLGCFDKMLTVIKKPNIFENSMLFSTLKKDLHRFNDSHNNHGFHALTRLVDNCKKLINLKDTDGFNNLCKRLNYDIKLNGPCYINHYATRVSRLFNHPYVENITLLNKSWISKCNTLLYFSQGRIRNLEGTINDFENLIEQEKCLLMSLEDYYEGSIYDDKL